jgi:acetoacetyl-CoA reductase
MKKIALVTGGTKGIGRGISELLKENGYVVAANYNSDLKSAEEFHDRTGIKIFSWDVSNYDASLHGVAKVRNELGGSIDILVNNAGITKDVMLHKMDNRSWDNVIAINLNSVFNMCRLVINEMREKNFGRIINISSINGIKGQVGQTNYSAAKAGIIGFTKSLALESASKGITVNAIAPGYISTDMTNAIPKDIREKIISTIPVGRFGDISEIANSVLFLAGEKSSFITGSVLNINGGQHL